MPIIAQAIARKPPRMPGARCKPGSRSTRCWAKHASAPRSLGLAPSALALSQDQKLPVSLSEPIAVATRFGGLFDLPEHPHEGNAQTDDDAQKYQRQARGCEHGQHP